MSGEFFRGRDRVFRTLNQVSGEFRQFPRVWRAGGPDSTPLPTDAPQPLPQPWHDPRPLATPKQPSHERRGSPPAARRSVSESEELRTSFGSGRRSPPNSHTLLLPMLCGANTAHRQQPSPTPTRTWPRECQTSLQLPAGPPVVTSQAKAPPRTQL